MKQLLTLLFSICWIASFIIGEFGVYHLTKAVTPAIKILSIIVYSLTQALIFISFLKQKP